MRVTYNAEFERRIRLCAIGCGGHAQRDIFPAFQYAPIDLVAVCDLDRDKAQTCARLWGAPAVYTDYREMLRQEQPAAVKDCSCSAMHRKSAPLASVCWTTIRLNGATCRMPWNYYEFTKHTAGRWSTRVDCQQLKRYLWAVGSTTVSSARVRRSRGICLT